MAKHSMHALYSKSKHPCLTSILRYTIFVVFSNTPIYFLYFCECRWKGKLFLTLNAILILPSTYLFIRDIVYLFIRDIVQRNTYLINKTAGIISRITSEFNIPLVYISYLPKLSGHFRENVNKHLIASWFRVYERPYLLIRTRSSITITTRINATSLF